MNSSLGIKIAAAAGVAVILIIVLRMRSGQQPPETPESPVTHGSSAARNPVEDRLKQLDAAHGRTNRRPESPLNEGAVAKAPRRPGSTPNANRVPPPHRPAAPPANANESDETNEDEIDVDPDDLPALKGIAVRDTDPERRLAAVTMLGTSEDPSVIPTLAQALSDEDDEVRLAAIQALSDFTGDAPVDLLSKVVVDDPSADNRYEALETLSDIGGERATSAIQRALNDPDEDVRALAEGLLDNEDTFQDNTQDADEVPTPAPAPGK